MIDTSVIGEPYPLDFEALQKGDLVTAEKLERIFNAKRESDQFRFEVMALIENIRKRRPDLAAHVRSSGHAIRIMHDDEAEEYGWQRIKKNLKSIGRTVERRASIDYNALPDERRRVAESRDAAGTALVLMGRKELMRANRHALLTGKKEKTEETK